MRSLLALLLCLSAPAAAADPSTTWDLTPIYADDAAWESARAALRERLDDLEPFRGRLASPTVLAEALGVWFAIDKDLSRLAGYASMRSDQDLRESGPQGMEQAVGALISDLEAEVSWFEPEILAIPVAKLAKARVKTPALAPYSRYLDRLEARRAHVLDADGERLLGLAGGAGGTGAAVSGILRNADMPWPTITLADGSTLKVNATGYSMGRGAASREDRLKTFTAFYGGLDAFGGSLAELLASTVKEHVFVARARGYDSAREASLAGNEVDPAVYDMLVREIGEGLPVLHRYLKLRADMLGIKDLGYHDLYPALVPEVAGAYTYERSKELVYEALKPLGDDYVEKLRYALEHRWVDVYPSEGKRSGAYVTDAFYDVHPYMLLNHTDDYEGMGTLAHEGGHLMHSAFSQAKQPYPTANYVIFVAEVASTVNEVLLVEHLLAKATDDTERLALLGQFLDRTRQTVFRQTMFAEFEHQIHAIYERGEPLSEDVLDQAYGDLLRRYHGHDQGVCRIDDLYEAEWAFIPHFHYDFYVYQYATSYVAALALARGILDDEPGAVERYRAFLSAGSTKPPVELLREAGVDMTKPDPIRSALGYMGTLLDRIEAIRAQQKK